MWPEQNDAQDTGKILSVTLERVRKIMQMVVCLTAKQEVCATPFP